MAASRCGTNAPARPCSIALPRLHRLMRSSSVLINYLESASSTRRRDSASYYGLNRLEVGTMNTTRRTYFLAASLAIATLAGMVGCHQGVLASAQSQDQG